MENEGEQSTDIEPRNEIEKIAERIDAPGVSKSPLNPSVVGSILVILETARANFCG